MDIRGIEVTNQLRSAIRAKLLELGIRYDEELPDYILVMVVNKKTRQQMHEDLYLFLESCTTPFVDWLHDQVLKKLQKVTVAKKKSSREFVPTVVVKQEEERRKRKTSTTSFLEDQQAATAKNLADEKLEQPSREKSAEGSVCGAEARGKTTDDAAFRSLKQQRLDATRKYGDGSERRQPETKRSKVEAEEAEEEEEGGESANDEGPKKLKSCVNKPTVTSVVSVKNRLGLVPGKTEFGGHRARSGAESRHRQIEKRGEKRPLRNGSFLGDSARDEPDDAAVVAKEAKPKGNCSARPTGGEKGTIKDRLGIASRHGKFSRQLEQDRDVLATGKNVKERLGPARRGNARSGNVKGGFVSLTRRPKGSENEKNEEGTAVEEGQPTQEEDDEDVKVHEVEEEELVVEKKEKKGEKEEEEYLNVGEEVKLNRSSEIGGIRVGPIKSRIIAVRSKVRAPIGGLKRKRLRALSRNFGKEVEKVGAESEEEAGSDAEERTTEARIPSKVIVTPRPLKPLQPTQKRATQSLLLKAVAEANQSVVTQKNPEPSLVDKKETAKRPKLLAVRDVGQNLSVHLNSNKRLVMEKIQVELHTGGASESNTKPRASPAAKEDHMDVVMSLFHRSTDNQKFLVTLNGYGGNNDLVKDKLASEEAKRLQTQVHDAECAGEEQLEEMGEEGLEAQQEQTEMRNENNENCNTENVEKAWGEGGGGRSRRKLSPIVYNRSRSPSPSADAKGIDRLSGSCSSSTKRSGRRAAADKASAGSAMVTGDKSKERCRYWPTCTLGDKCAYTHPAVMCSAFPVCKFGDKCAYKHPKCKFGLSCTKLGCVFSHPAQRCKYHPFCAKPACPYSHPLPVVAESSSQRAKFTWRRRD